MVPGSLILIINTKNILRTEFNHFFDRFLGSGQKLLARLLDEHPFVTVKQPSNYIRHVSLFSEAWFEEESLETNRLNEGGISKEVLLDTLQVCSKLKPHIRDRRTRTDGSPRTEPGPKNFRNLGPDRRNSKLERLQP